MQRIQTIAQTSPQDLTGSPVHVVTIDPPASATRPTLTIVTLSGLDPANEVTVTEQQAGFTFTNGPVVSHAANSVIEIDNVISVGDPPVVIRIACPHSTAATFTAVVYDTRPIGSVGAGGNFTDEEKAQLLAGIDLSQKRILGALLKSFGVTGKKDFQKVLAALQS